MTEAAFLRWLIVGWLALSLVTFVALLRITSPYGRHARRGWGPQIGDRLGWVLMETPAVLIAPILLLVGHRYDPVALVFLAMWEIHYLHRAWVFPLRRRDRGKQIAVSVALLGVTFNLGNGYINGRWLFGLAPVYPTAWFTDPRFLVGAACFFAGLAVNVHADEVLLRLRRPGETGYKIPHGGLYRLVSCPNYLGELIEWTGWAIATWSVGGLTFAVWSFANLVPRALDNHRWYRQKFPDYPRERRAILPFLL